jgi:RimJ/RimL family protein N-acetyltransferase
MFDWSARNRKLFDPILEVLDIKKFYKGGICNATYATTSRKTSSIRMIASEEGRYKLGHFLLQGLCDKYQGSYDPHYLTGLGSILWILEHYWKDTPIATNALYQYLDFFFSRLE